MLSVLLFLTDIIFCIYLYQRWIYRVDPKRVNEFGTSAEMLDQQGAADGQNGTLPGLDSLTNPVEAAADPSAEVAADAAEMTAQPEKSKSEKKED